MLKNILTLDKSLKPKYPDALLIYSDFKETYTAINNDAIYISQKTGFVLKKRNSIPYINFEKGNLELTITKLVRSGNRVAIVDNLKN